MGNHKFKLIIKIILLFFFLVILCGCVWYGYSMRITKINILGNHVYTDDQIENLIFETSLEKNTFVCFLNEKRGKTKSIPFVDHYEITLLDADACEIMVYEKSIIGCFRYMGSYMYFDRDGIIVENSFDRLKGVPLVEGLEFRQVVLHNPLPVADDKIFQNILALSNLLKKCNINTDKMLYESDNSVVLYLNEVKVQLGDSSNLEEKIQILNSMKDKLQDLSGTLYLDSYNPTGENKTFLFKEE